MFHRYLLAAIYHMLKDETMYKDLDRNHFDRRSTDQQQKRLVKTCGRSQLCCGDQASRAN